MLAKSHVLMKVFVSVSAREALLDTPDSDEAVNRIVKKQLRRFYRRFADGYVADINGVYADVHRLYGSHVVMSAACKPRGYRKAISEVGWYIGLMTPDEYIRLTEAPEDEVNQVAVEILRMDDDSIDAWCNSY